MLDRGVIIRHMVLPGAKEDSIRLLHWIRENLPDHQYLISIMSQYTPFYRNTEYPEINRRITAGADLNEEDLDALLAAARAALANIAER